jgi:hypothetical protein
VKTSQILTLSVALAAVGVLLLCGGPDGVPRARSAAATVAAAPTPARTRPPVSSTATARPAAAITPVTAAAGPSLLPANALAPDDGPGGDHLIQAMLEAHTPHNLPPSVEQRLDQLGRAVWLADLTGQGRTQWPRYFTTSGTSGYSSVRIQAAAAHSTGSGHAEVSLLWAGTSPAGDPEVGLPATVQLAQQSDGTWEPMR